MVHRRLSAIITELNFLKRMLWEKWKAKGEFDQEILDLSEKIDELLNEHQRLLRELAG